MLRRRALTAATSALKRASKGLSQTARLLDLARLDLDYRRDERDIFVASYPKSGTTWVQMILYQLTTDGQKTITHIDEVSPHLEETLLWSGRTISDLPPPRIVKTHLTYHRVPKGPGRYLYVLRDGRDVATSYYHQQHSAHRDFASYFTAFMRGTLPYGSWFAHVAAWLRNRGQLRLHVVRYEDLVADLEGSIRRIAEFCELPIDPDQLPRVVRNCTFEAMKQNESLFNLTNRFRARFGEPPKMIRNGQVGDWRNHLDGAMQARFAAALRSSGIPERAAASR